MPTPDQLPEKLQELAYRHAVVVRPDPDFRSDAAKCLPRPLPAMPCPEPPPAPPPSPRPLPGPLPAPGPSPSQPDITRKISAEPHPGHRRAVVAAACAVVVAAVTAGLVWRLVNDDGDSTTTTPAGDVVTALTSNPSLSEREEAEDVVRAWADVIDPTQLHRGSPDRPDAITGRSGDLLRRCRRSAAHVRHPAVLRRCDAGRTGLDAHGSGDRVGLCRRAADQLHIVCSEWRSTSTPERRRGPRARMGFSGASGSEANSSPRHLRTPAPDRP